MMEPRQNDLMTITLDSMRFYAFHGVGAQERVVGNEFEVTVSVDLDPPCSDDLDATVSYADIAAVVSEEMQSPSDLIEHVAMRIRNRLVCTFPAIKGGAVTVAKPKPPMAGIELKSASVTLRWKTE